ncbi:MAG: hypothetical protein Q9160_002943 [Pyrenula sp. 1 TL-2023]
MSRPRWPLSATSTVTADIVGLTVIPIHPLYLYNLQHQPYGCSRRPLTYNSALPSPATVPGNPSDYTGSCTNDVKARAPEPTAFNIRRAATSTASSLSTPTFIASTIPPSRISSACSCLTIPFSSAQTVNTATTTTTRLKGDLTQQTSTCLSYDKKPAATFPALCAPSLQANAPSVVSSPPNIQTISPIPVPDKLSCCAACVKIFNCVWWTFTFSNSKNPDPWAPGKCVYAYNTAPTGSPNILDAQNDAPPVCPNGIVSGLLGQTGFSGKEGVNKLSGYNQGPCGDALNTYESAQDFGYPDDDPYGNAAQC